MFIHRCQTANGKNIGIMCKDCEQIRFVSHQFKA